jgi:hypothetical protein
MKQFKGFDIKTFENFDEDMIEKFKNDENVHDVFIKEEVLVVRYIK